MGPFAPAPNSNIQQRRKQANAAGQLATSLSNNPLTPQVKANPQRLANAERRKRSLSDLAGTQERLASPTFGQYVPPTRTLNDLSNPSHQRGPDLLSQPAPAMVPGQQAASSIVPVGLHPAATSIGHTDQYNITTRRGVSTPGPVMGNQAAINAAYDARKADHVMPSVQPGQRVAQGMTTDRLFPSPGQAGDRAKFEAYKEGRADQSAKARKMRTQRAQYRNATGDYRSTPMFGEDGRMDLMGTIAAQQMRSNPRLSLAALENQQELKQGDRRLDQLATNESNRFEMDGKRFGLEETLGNARVADLSEARRLQQIGLENDSDRISNEMALGQGRLSLDGLAQQYAQGDLAHERRLSELGINAGTPAAPQDRIRSMMDFDQQDPATQSQAIAAGGRAIAQDPSRAGEITSLVGASPEAMLQAYNDAHQNDSSFFEDDLGSQQQQATIEDLGRMLDANGIPRPKLKRELPWLQEFIGLSYPEANQPKLDDLATPAVSQ